MAVNYIAGHGKPRFEATLSQGLHRLALVFFHGAYLRRQIHPGIHAAGPRTRSIFPRHSADGQSQMGNRRATTQSIEDAKLRALYPASAKLASEKIERIIAANLDAAAGAIGEWFDARFSGRRGNSWAAPRHIGRIHQPIDRRQAIAARRRLVYDELILMQLALALSHRLNSAKISAPMLRIDKTLDRRIRAPISLRADRRPAERGLADRRAT